MSAGAHELAVLQANTSGKLLPFRWPAKRRSSPTAQEWAGAFFILVNAALFVRPAEIIPALEDWPIYGVLMTCALLVALPLILQQVTYESLSRRPITVCVLGLFICTITSHLSKGATWEARASGAMFFKLVLYYLLLTATVTNVARLRRFLVLLVALGVIVTTLALLQYHGLIDIPALEEIEQSVTDPQTGESLISLRLVSTGIFHDPNDLCLLLVLTMSASACGLEDCRWGAWRLLFIAPLGLFGYALTLTQSRGGFIAFLSALVTWIWLRLGWRRGLPVCLFALLGAFYLFAGRQTDLNLGSGTSQGRIQIWSDGLTLFRQNAIFGVGQGTFTAEVQHAAHNSFLHSFAELGFVGGALFLGAFAQAVSGLYRIGKRTITGQTELARMRHYLMAAVVGYVAGLMSLSRCYVVPTYLVLGLAGAYIRIARSCTAGPIITYRYPVIALRMIVLAVLFLAGMYVFIRVFVHWG